MRCAVGVLLLLMLSACDREPLFRPPPQPERPPKATGAFHRITFNPGPDLSPSWLTDDSTISYAFEPADVGVTDRCLGLIPAEGGMRRPIPCLLRNAADSIALSTWPVATAMGRLAYVWEPIPPYPANPLPDSALVFVEQLAQPGVRTAAFQFPFIIPGSRLYHTLTHVAWLDEHTLIGVGITATVTQDCGGCPFRPVRLGRDVVRLDLSAIPGVLTQVSGTVAATGVSVGAAGDIYYTVAGDSRVYRRVLSSPGSTVAHDFGAAGIARDPRVIGSRLVAVVGGKVTVRNDALLGPVQDDSGGALHVVNLGTGADSVLPDSGYFYQHPALAPSGNKLVAVGRQGARSELWFFRLP